MKTFTTLFSSVGKTAASLILLGALLFGAVHSAIAQGYVVNASIASQAVGDGTYNYTITLNNDASSMNPVSTFWFAWVPDDYGYDLLPSSPSNIQGPSGWFNYVSGPFSYYYADGYSIQFYTSSAPLNPGSSLTFGFNSADAPSVVEGTSQYNGSYAASASYVYMGYAEGDQGALIGLTPVPEPGTNALILFGTVTCLFVTRRHGLVNRLIPARLRAR